MDAGAGYSTVVVTMSTVLSIGCAGGRDVLCPVSQFLQGWCQETLGAGWRVGSATGAETRDGGNLGTRAGAVISHFQDTYLGRAEIIMTVPAQA